MSEKEVCPDCGEELEDGVCLECGWPSETEPEGLDEEET